MVTWQGEIGAIARTHNSYAQDNIDDLQSATAVSVKPRAVRLKYM